MAPNSEVFVAGVGFSPSRPGDSSTKGVIKSLVSAATKALLDAGVTYDDVTQGVTTKSNESSNYEIETFQAFDEDAIAIDTVQRGSELEGSIAWIKSKGAECVLMIVVEKSAAVAFVLVSDRFFWSRPYLKDSAIAIREAEDLLSSSKGAARSGLYDVCQTVWALRGWSSPEDTTGRKGHWYQRSEPNQSFGLSRADAKAIPKWEDVEHKQDGKYCLGYNPATETRDISQEDFEAVRASGKAQKGANDWTPFERRGGDRAALARL